MNRTSVRTRRRRFGLLAAVTVAGGIWAAPFGHGEHALASRPVAAHRVVVRPGDTVWTLATRVSGGSDPRPLVDAILRANHVDPGSISPGEVLVVPSL